jgi:hypothetical protein
MMSSLGGQALGIRIRALNYFILTKFIRFEAAAIGHLSLPGDSPPGLRIKFEQCVRPRHFSQHAA